MTRLAFTSLIVSSFCLNISSCVFVVLMVIVLSCAAGRFQHEFFVWFSSSSSSSSSPLAIPMVFVLFLSLSLFLLSLPLFVGNPVCCSQTLARVPYLFLLCVLLMNDISVRMFLSCQTTAPSPRLRGLRGLRGPQKLPLSFLLINVYTLHAPHHSVSSSLVCSPLFLVVSLQALTPSFSSTSLSLSSLINF